MTTPKKKTTRVKKKATAPSTNLPERVLDDAQTLRPPLSAEMLDAALSRAEQEGLLHLNFLQLILGEPAVRSRQRAVERRIREARFREQKTLAQFDWKFNASTIDRAQIEQLATGEFVRRGEHLVMMGQSGVGKSRLLQSLSRRFCELGYRVRYTTSADLLEDLRKSLADESLPRRVRYWALPRPGRGRSHPAEDPRQVLSRPPGQEAACSIQARHHLSDSPCEALMPGIDYHQVRQQVSMAQVLGLIGFQVAWRRGPQLRGPCPIPGCRSSSRRAFSVHLTRQLYHCFACGSHGNLLDLWAAVRRLPLHPATVDLCRTAGLPLPCLLTSPTTSTLSESQPVPFRAPSRNR